MTKQRNFTIDVARSFAVILVIFGHAFNHYGTIFNIELNLYRIPLRVYVYSFHMPIFALISGYLFYFSCKKHNFKEIIFNRINNLFIPILAWNTLIFILSVLNNGLSVVSIGGFYSTVTYFSWFLWAVLFATAVIAFIHYFLKSSIIVYIFVAVLLHIVDVKAISSIFHIAKDALDLWFFLYSYVMVGFIFAKYKDSASYKLENHKKFTLITTVIFGVIHILLMLIYKNDYTVYNYGVYVLNDFPKSVFIILLRFVIGLCGSCFWLSLFNMINAKKLPSAIIKFIQMISGNSIVIYILCSYILGVIFIDFVDLPFMSLPLYVLLDVIINLIIGIIVAKIIKTNKIASKLFVGR